MQGLEFLMVLFVAFAALAMFALALGVDSRPDFGDDRAPVGRLSI